jgi:hypothetical protein
MNEPAFANDLRCEVHATPPNSASAPSFHSHLDRTALAYCLTDDLLTTVRSRSGTGSDMWCKTPAVPASTLWRNSGRKWPRVEDDSPQPTRRSQPIARPARPALRVDLQRLHPWVPSPRPVGHPLTRDPLALPVEYWVNCLKERLRISVWVRQGNPQLLSI